jgi:sensor histidine kinase regulating citrate/malate metabolism
MTSTHGFSAWLTAALLDAIGECVVGLDAKGRCQYVSQPMLALLQQERLASEHVTFVRTDGVTIPAAVGVQALPEPGELRWFVHLRGLAVVYAMVQAQGGSLALQSEPGAGSTFHLLVPVRRVDWI